MYNVLVKSRNFEKKDEIIFIALGVDAVNLTKILDGINISPAYYVEIKEAMNEPEEIQEDEVIKAMETIKQFCKDCDQCHGCRFRNREWGKRCLLNEDIPAFWKYYKEEGESNE